MKQQSTVASSKFKRANKAGHFRRILYSAEQKFCQRAPTKHIGSFERFVISQIGGYVLTGINWGSAHEMRSTLRVQKQD